MKIIKRMLCILFLSAVLLAPCRTSLCYGAPADSEAASLSIIYRHGERAFEGLEIKIYRVAELHVDGTYSLCGAFGDYPVSIYGITSASEWKSVTSTLASYAVSDGIEADFTAVTNSEGSVTFEDIPHGMYLVSEVTAEGESETFSFEQFISLIPRPAEDGTYEHNVTAIPKYEHVSWEDNSIELKVVKLWRDEDSKNRPDSVSVEILKNGVSVETVTLSAENNWSYRWDAANDGSVWTAVERSVPDGYTVTSVKDGGTFVITNTLEESAQTPPQTNDTTHLTLYILILSVSGVLLIILAAVLLRRRGGEDKGDEEKN